MRLSNRHYWLVGALLVILCANLVLYLRNRGVQSSRFTHAGTLFVCIQTAIGRTPELAEGGVFRVRRTSPAPEAIIDRLPTRMRVAPGGQSIAYCYGGTLYVSNQKTSDVLLGECTGVPVWSPDASWIVCSQGQKAADGAWKYESWKFANDGSSREHLAIPSTDVVRDWSPDGRWFLTISSRRLSRSASIQIYLIDVAGTQRRQVTESGVNTSPRFSPDGAKVLFSHQDRGRNSLCVQSIESKSSNPVIIYGPVVQPIRHCCWSSDGKWAAFVTSADNDCVRIVEVSGGSQEQIDFSGATWIGPIDWH